jgi:hypothetical protein
MPGNKVGAGNKINAPELREVPETRQERCWLTPNKRRNRRAARDKKAPGTREMLRIRDELETIDVRETREDKRQDSPQEREKPRTSELLGIREGLSKREVRGTDKK